MSWTRERVTVMAVCTLSVLLSLTSLSTTAWMKGCMASENFLVAESKQYSEFNHTEPTYLEEDMILFKGTQMCIHLGLFRVAMNFGGVMNMGFNTPASSLPTYTLATAVGLISALIFVLAAGFLHANVANAVNGSYEARSRLTRHIRLTMICMTSATLVSFGAMIAYAAGSSYVVHQPLHFMAQSGNSIMHVLASQPPTNFARRRRDLDISSLDDDTESYLRAMVRGLDPDYGYSFILGWMVVLANALALALTVVVKQCMLKRRHPDIPLDF